MFSKITISKQLPWAQKALQPQANLWNWSIASAKGNLLSELNASSIITGSCFAHQSKVAGSTSSYTKKNDFVINQDTKLNPYNDDTLDKVLNNATQSMSGPSADDSYSSIQSSKSISKSGWCFIGEDRGYRSCVEVGENDKCMSGDIFPTKDICINPTLRE